MSHRQWAVIKDSQLHCVIVDSEKKEIRYNPNLAMIRFETTDRFFVYQWDLKRPEDADVLGKEVLNVRA